MLKNRILICLLYLFGLSIKAQDIDQGQSALFVDKRSRYSGHNLKGPVKSIHFEYTYLKEDTSQYKHNQHRIKFKNDISKSKKTTFSKDGFITSSDLFFQINYNNDDIISKSSLKHKKKQLYPVYDYKLLVKANNDDYSNPDEDYKSINHQNFEYVFDSIGRIRYELSSSSTQMLDSIFKDMPDDPLNVKTEFIYDTRNNVVRQKILKISGDPLPLNLFGTETPYCTDMRIDYSYDDKDRITKIVFFSCKQIVFEEAYTYAKEGFVSEVDRYYSGLSSYSAHHLKAYYNENADIIHMHLLTPDNRLWIGNEPANRYYDYEYDNYGNWIKCTLYLEGKKEDGISAIAVRKIEYYE